MIPFYENSDYNIRAFQTRRFHFPAHLHDQLELVYVLESKLQITINGLDLILQKGDFIIIFPNTIHSYNPSFSNKPFHNSILIAICGMMLTGDYLNTLMNYHPLKPYIRSKDLHNDVVFSMKSLVAEISSTKNISACKAYLQLILARTMPSLKLLKNESVDSHDLIYQIVNYISLNFREYLRLDVLATHLGVSPYYLSRIFSSKLNTSFNDYVNNIRISYASTLILTTNNSMTQICNDSGFDSQRTFNRVFKKTFNMTPREYRYKNRSIDRN